MNTTLKKFFSFALIMTSFTSIPIVVGRHQTVSAQGLSSGRIVFSSNRDGGPDEIYVMNADGSGLIRLTNNMLMDTKPVWSPNGAQIVFENQGNSNAAICVMNADGSNVVCLTDRSAEDMYPSWSPDGTQIAFYSNRDGNMEIYVMNADGSNQTNLTNSPTTTDIGRAVWSPDGKQIAFTRYDPDGYSNVYVMRADGSDQTNLTNQLGADSGFPAWSPDGTRIAFWSRRDGNGEIYVMNADGSNQTRLTTTAAWEYPPAWSPNGTQIVFHSSRDSSDEIYVMNADGSNQTRLTDLPGNDQFPNWTGNSGGCAATAPTTIYQGDAFTLTLYCQDISSSVFGFQAGHMITIGANLVTAQSTNYVPGTIFQGQQTLAGPNTLPLYALSLQAGGTQATGTFTLGAVEYLALTPGQVTFDVVDLILGGIDGNALPNVSAPSTATTVTISDLVLGLSGTVDPQGYAHASALTFTLNGNPAYAALTPTYNATTGNTAFTYTNIKGHPVSLEIDAPSHVACVESLTFPTDAGNEVLPNPLILRAGDVNSDNHVDITDAAVIGQGYGLLPTGELDINHDGAVNILDLIHVGRNYDTTGPTDCTS